MPATTTPQVADVVGYGAATAPTNWLLCNGAAVSRTTFAALFAAIGTVFGIGDGSTTFNVPSIKGRIPQGVLVNAGVNGGTIDHTHTGPPHGHSVTQAAAHGSHSSDGAHAHNNHNRGGRSTLVATASRLTGPQPHSSVGGHTHAVHSAHAGAAVASATPGATGTANPPFQAITYIIHT